LTTEKETWYGQDLWYKKLLLRFEKMSSLLHRLHGP
jgi:hypothetical protein